MDRYKSGDVVSTSSQVLKVKKFTQVSEFLLVNSLKHPHIIGCESIEFPRRSSDNIYGSENDTCIMAMKKGTPVELTVENFLKILETLIYLEHHGIIYGDLKTNNIVMVDNRVKLIDFGLMNFSGLEYRGVSQTYSDGFQYTWNNEKEKYSHRKNLIWAIGILALEFFAKLSFSDKAVYSNFVMLTDALLKFNEEAIGEWLPFVKMCLTPYEDRIDSVEELWKSLPSQYYREMNVHPVEPKFHHLNNERVERWNMYLDVIPFWMYTYLYVHSSRKEIISRAISLFKEYYHWFLPETTPGSVSNSVYETVPNDILSFACSCILLTADVFDETIDIISLSDNLDREISDEEISSMLIRFLDKLEYRLPHSLIEKREIYQDCLSTDALLQAITNPNNYSYVRDTLSQSIQPGENGIYTVNPEASQYISNFLKEWSKMTPGFIMFQ